MVGYIRCWGMDDERPTKMLYFHPAVSFFHPGASYRRKNERPEEALPDDPEQCEYFLNRYHCNFYIFPNCALMMAEIIRALYNKSVFTPQKGESGVKKYFFISIHPSGTILYSSH